jgi:hypothetical protein
LWERCKAASVGGLFALHESERVDGLTTGNCTRVPAYRDRIRASNLAFDAELVDRSLDFLDADIATAGGGFAGGFVQTGFAVAPPTGPLDLLSHRGAVA